jgi:glycosyltransferase involved in cell wall biosynthesis
MSMNAPLVSVVMGVHNAGETFLQRTIDSVLNQQEIDLEFIIINDGSTDCTREILEGYSHREKRIRLFHQQNEGLTCALIRGCAAVRGKYIARQDAGDISFPLRLKSELTAIETNANFSFVSAATRFVDPQGEFLFDIYSDPLQATSRLMTLNPRYVRGPSIHGCTLFPKSLYDHVGGYRPEFYFAQDLDLWMRFIEHGKHLVISDVLYQATVRADSITGLYRKEQSETAKIVVEAARLRRSGRDEEPALKKARRIRPDAARRESRLQLARGFYFIGMCLKVQRNPRANWYFQQALRTSPLHLKSAIRLIF